MGYYVKTDGVTVAVGIVEQSVIAPFSTRGEDLALIIIENLSVTETFNGYVWSSPNGNNGWVVEDNDAFVGILPMKSRRLLLPADRINLRLLGNFVAAPDNVRVTVYVLHNAVWTPAALTSR